MEEPAEPRPHARRDAGDGGSEIDRADSQRGRRAARASDAPECRTAGAVVPRRDDDERVEAHRARRGVCERAVGKGREGLGERDEGDPSGIVGITVRGSGPRHARGLRSSDRSRANSTTGRQRHAASQHTRIGSTPTSGASPCGRPGAPRPATMPAVVGAVRLEPISAWTLVVARGRSAVDDVEARQHDAVKERRGGIDGRVEQRDRDTASSVLGKPRRQRAPGDVGRLAERGGVRSPDREHTLDAGERSSSTTALGSAIAEKPLTTRVNRRSGFAIDALRGELGEELLLPREHGRRPAALLHVGRQIRRRAAHGRRATGACSRTITRCPSATAGAACRRGLATPKGRGVESTSRHWREPSGTVTACNRRRRPRRGRPQRRRGYATAA